MSRIGSCVLGVDEAGHILRAVVWVQRGTQLFAAKSAATYPKRRDKMVQSWRSGAFLAANLLGAAALAQPVSFSTTESGVFDETTVFGSSTLVDALTVTEVDLGPTTLTLDSSLLVATQSDPGSPLSGTFFLYGKQPTDFLEFQFSGATEASIGQGTWLTAKSNLVGSGGALGQYVSGSGDLAVFLLPTASSGTEITGTSSVMFGGGVSPAPEPASTAAMVIGLVGVLARRRRNR